MSRYYKTTFWERWLIGALMFFPITAMTSCFAPMLMMGEWKTGLLVWAVEDVVLGLGLATCPEAEAFKKPWWDAD
jgi:hypothetical protein